MLRAKVDGSGTRSQRPRPLRLVIESQGSGRPVPLDRPPGKFRAPYAPKRITSPLVEYRRLLRNDLRVADDWEGGSEVPTAPQFHAADGKSEDVRVARIKQAGKS